jgi:hypothetical protein
VTSEVLHQLVMVVAAGKAGLMPLELMSNVHLGNGQSNCRPMTNAMESDLLDAHKDVLEVIRQQIASVFRALAALFAVSWRAFNSSIRAVIRAERIIKKSMTEQNNRGTGFLLRILPMTLVSKSTSRAQAMLLSPSMVARAVWEAAKAASRCSVPWVASQ